MKKIIVIVLLVAVLVMGFLGFQNYQKEGMIHITFGFDLGNI